MWQSLLDLMTPIFWKRKIILRSDNVFRYFFHCSYRKFATFLFTVSIWPNDLEHASMLRSALGWFFTKFELDQPINSWLI